MKIGTHPATEVHVVRKRKEPEIGNYFEFIDPETSKPAGAIVREVKEIGDRRLFYLERM